MSTGTPILKYLKSLLNHLFHYQIKKDKIMLKYNIINPKSQDKFVNLYTNITDKERLAFGQLGLKTNHILLLKRFLILSRKNPLFAFHNSCIRQLLGVCDKTVSNYIKLLEKKGFIKTSISYYEGYKKKRLISLTSLSVKMTDKKQNKLTKAIARDQIQKNKKNNSLSIKEKSIHKLTSIFYTKCIELGYTHLDNHILKQEALKFDNYYQNKGFNKWTLKNGVKQVYKAVNNWVINDKGGYFEFLKSKKVRLDIKKTQERKEIKQSQDPLLSIGKRYMEVFMQLMKKGLSYFECDKQAENTLLMEFNKELVLQYTRGNQ